MILAVGFAVSLAMIALIALSGLLLRREAQRTPEGRAERYVTPEELADALEKHAKHLEWEWTEMYEKFNKLHLRLSKRDKRSQQNGELPLSEPGESERPGVLALRRFGSP